MSPTLGISTIYVCLPNGHHMLCEAEQCVTAEHAEGTAPHKEGPDKDLANSLQTMIMQEQSLQASQTEL